MKKILLFSALLVWILFSGHTVAEPLIFNTQDFKPFSYETSGVVSGPGADIIREVCKTMGTACSIRMRPAIFPGGTAR